MTTPYAFMLDTGEDPEELLENACLWKVLHDRMGERIVAHKEMKTLPAATTHVFGRTDNRDLYTTSYTYPSAEMMGFPYWEHPLFLANARRSLEVHDLEGACRRVAAIHATGRDAFVKATRSKYWLAEVPVGQTLLQVMDGMEYSFIDGGPRLIVQERVEMRFEYRFFVVDGELSTGASCIASMTPFQNARETYSSAVAATPSSPVIYNDPKLVNDYVQFARPIAQALPWRFCTLDVATIEGEVGIVEMNPLHLGRTGLFACNLPYLVQDVLKALSIETAF